MSERPESKPADVNGFGNSWCGRLFGTGLPFIILFVFVFLRGGLLWNGAYGRRNTVARPFLRCLLGSKR